MHTKRTTFPTKMKIGVYLKDAQESAPACYQSVLQSEKAVCLKMQICIERIGENAIFKQFHAIVPDISSSGRLENTQTTN